MKRNKVRNAIAMVGFLSAYVVLEAGHFSPFHKWERWTLLAGWSLLAATFGIVLLFNKITLGVCFPPGAAERRRQYKEERERNRMRPFMWPVVVATMVLNLLIVLPAVYGVKHLGWDHDTTLVWAMVESVIMLVLVTRLNAWYVRRNSQD
ncbi:MAG TPA: hypothetical protein VFX37_13475 [Pseudolabrys sp.]|nr:hypothetical protein [Pseudolabrys sp.]